MKTKKLMQQIAAILIAVSVIGASSYAFACSQDSSGQCKDAGASCTKANGAAGTCTQHGKYCGCD